MSVGNAWKWERVEYFPFHFVTTTTTTTANIDIPMLWNMPPFKKIPVKDFIPFMDVHL